MLFLSFFEISLKIRMMSLFDSSKYPISSILLVTQLYSYFQDNLLIVLERFAAINSFVKSSALINFTLLLCLVASRPIAIEDEFFQPQGT